MQLVFLSNKFYQFYSGCAEIEQKSNRPYVMVCIHLNGFNYAVPLRSNITHPHVFWTDKQNHCGVDFSKAVVLWDPQFIDTSRTPHIRQNEFDALRGKEYLLEQHLLKYIQEYKRAKRMQHISRYQTLVAYSTLQYFEEYL